MHDFINYCLVCNIYLYHLLMVAFVCNFFPHIPMFRNLIRILLFPFENRNPPKCLWKKSCANVLHVYYVCGYLINWVLFTPVLLHWCIIMHAASELKISKIAWWLNSSTLHLSHIHSRRGENLKITCKKFRPNMVSHPTTDNYLPSQGQIGCILW